MDLASKKSVEDESLAEVTNATKDHNSAVAFLRQKKVLRREPPRCTQRHGRQMTEVKSGQSAMWRCPRHKNVKLSLRHGSFFADSSLRLEVLIHLVWAWACELTVENAAKLTGTCRTSVMTWFDFMRCVCNWWLVNNPFGQLGGPGIIVQIEKPVIVRRKYHRGRRVAEKWVFGAYCTRQRVLRLVQINSRSAVTLLGIIRKWIAPGSIICSDSFASYKGLANVPVNPPYIHRTVDSSGKFLDPVSGATVNGVVRFWSNSNRRLRIMSLFNDAQLQKHLDESMWRQQHGCSPSEAFHNVLHHISQWYETP